MKGVWERREAEKLVGRVGRRKERGKKNIHFQEHHFCLERSGSVNSRE